MKVYNTNTKKNYLGNVLYKLCNPNRSMNFLRTKHKNKLKKKQLARFMTKIKQKQLTTTKFCDHKRNCFLNIVQMSLLLTMMFLGYALPVVESLPISLY